MGQGQRSRGKITKEDIKLYENLSFEQLKLMLYDKEGYKRTIAINLLGENYLNIYEDELSDIFINIVKSEKTLYARIEAQEMLRKGSSITIKKLCANILVVENNQHNKLPDKITKKKTYPIARDLFVRILSKMKKEALDELKLLINSGDERIICEALDGVGYILYHDKSGINEEDYLINLFQKYRHNELLLWKLIRCMSGTKSNKVLDFLKEINFDNKILNDEKIRTIAFIENKI